MEMMIAESVNGGARVAIVRSPASLRAIKKGYEGNGDFVVLGLQVRSSQREMLQELSKQRGESQASVLRAIIDEWCEHMLASQGE